MSSRAEEWADLMEVARAHSHLLESYADVRNATTEAELACGCKDASRILRECADAIASLLGCPHDWIEIRTVGGSAQRCCLRCGERE